MTKAELLETMRTERTAWGNLLGEVGEARMSQPGVAGHWSVKDIIVHVTAYEQWLVTWLEAASRGELPPPSPLNNPDIDERNEVIYAENQARPVRDVLAEAKQVFDQLLNSVEGLLDVDLTDPHRTEWFVKPYWSENPPLWDAIAGDSYEHYHEHIPSIRAWLDTQG
jgi:hypothetical protein